MKFLWILFLLLGAVTCAPVQQEGFGNSGADAVRSYMALTSAQDPPGPMYEKPAGQFSDPDPYQAYPDLYYSSAANDVGGDVHSGYGAQRQPYGNSGDDSSQQYENWSSSDPEDEEEPYFTPVTDEDQVYAYKSRSLYNQKRIMMSQFKYTPTESLLTQEPVFAYAEKALYHKSPPKGQH